MERDQKDVSSSTNRSPFRAATPRAFGNLAAFYLVADKNVRAPSCRSIAANIVLTTDRDRSGLFAQNFLATGGPKAQISPHKHASTRVSAVSACDGMTRMSSSKQGLVVLVTAPDRPTARRLAKAALRSKLAACANLMPGLESHYWWEGKIEHSAEVLILFKTTRRNQRALEQLVLKEHPYDTPEFVVLNIERANRRYLAWWLESCR